MQTEKQNYAVEEKLKDLPFLFQDHDFTVEEVRQVLRVVFQTKTSRSLGQFTAYGLKHLMEWIADFSRGRPQAMQKYCPAKTMKEALVLEGFTNFGDEHATHYNVSAREYLYVFNLINRPDRVYSLTSKKQSQYNRVKKAIS